jgi:hypothetical protein
VLPRPHEDDAEPVQRAEHDEHGETDQQHPLSVATLSCGRDVRVRRTLAESIVDR